MMVRGASEKPPLSSSGVQADGIGREYRYRQV